MKSLNKYSSSVTRINPKFISKTSFGRKLCSDEIDEDSNRFNGIEDCAQENRQYKAILAHFKLSEIRNNEIYELISSEHGDNLLDDQK